MAKKIVLEVVRDHFRVCGFSEVSLWGGGIASIEMDGFCVNSLKEIKEKINDGKFGVKTIIGAVCHIYDCFPAVSGIRYRKTVFINLNGELSDKFIEDSYEWVPSTENIRY